MYLCYIDESGTPEIPGNTSHFILAGLSMPIWHWRDADREITRVMTDYDLAEQEFHSAWILRKYLEQSRIQGFVNMDWAARRAAVQRARAAHLLHLQQLQQPKAYKQARKNYRHTEPYIHLTYDERISLVRDVADVVSGWGFAVTVRWRPRVSQYGGAWRWVGATSAGRVRRRLRPANRRRRHGD
jgi:hypothetical protein